jgi:hypothetical protein
MEKKKQISVTKKKLFFFFLKKPLRFFGRPRDDPWLPKITTLCFQWMSVQLGVMSRHIGFTKV